MVLDRSGSPWRPAESRVEPKSALAGASWCGAVDPVRSVGLCGRRSRRMHRESRALPPARGGQAVQAVPQPCFRSSARVRLEKARYGLAVPKDPLVRLMRPCDGLIKLLSWENAWRTAWYGLWAPGAGRYGLVFCWEPYQAVQAVPDLRFACSARVRLSCPRYGLAVPKDPHVRLAAGAVRLSRTEPLQAVPGLSCENRAAVRLVRLDLLRRGPYRVGWRRQSCRAWPRATHRAELGATRRVPPRCRCGEGTPGAAGTRVRVRAEMSPPPTSWAELRGGAAGASQHEPVFTGPVRSAPPARYGAENRDAPAARSGPQPPGAARGSSQSRPSRGQRNGGSMRYERRRLRQKMSPPKAGLSWSNRDTRRVA